MLIDRKDGVINVCEMKFSQAEYEISDQYEKNIRNKLEVFRQESETQKFEERIHHLADQMITIDLDDGVKVNYAKFQDVLEKLK